MSRRIADLLCDRHLDYMLDTELWPREWAGNVVCADCDSGHLDLLPQLNPDLQLAFHEAGHALCHQLTGSTVELVMLDFGGRGLGGVKFATKDGTYDLAALMAGAAAVALWAQSYAPLAAEDVVDVIFGARHDFVDAWRCGVTEDDLGRALTVADGLVADSWAGVERIAETLLSRRSLTGQDVLLLGGLR